MTSKLTSIIIPSFNGLTLLQRLIDSIREHTDPKATPYEIIVVDNGSSDGTCQWCIDQRIPFVSLADNVGFPAACNQGLRIATGDQLMLLNNDIVATPNWLANLSAGLEQESDIGLTGPITNYASGIQQADYRFDSLEQFMVIAADVNHPDASKRVRVMRIVGLCMLFKREVYEKVGELDERFSPGHYEDDDYCLRIRMHGYSLLMCQDALIYHEGSASFRRTSSAEVEQLIARNRQLYIDKWGIDPGIFIGT
ncbi:glycosyltransferase family 2 protein [Paenibacillus xylaniclasticus]|uniref:glycosyltransferase family 2 protein n=1 Tax=Paenibacillus xylaniclasticus TaxID=588083 RepID=UPI000FD8393E|nr:MULTISPECIES: glycosyltransferase family 2 protein [Paenibacillus]GFN31004.1 glycosyl transferase [Paenibacillus curdlanolyticus]